MRQLVEVSGIAKRQFTVTMTRKALNIPQYIYVEFLTR